MYYKLFFILMLFSVTPSLFAQNVRLAYFGENVTHYGVRGGLEYALHHSEKPKGTSTIQNELTLGINLTVFRHPNNHIGVILSPELGWRRTGKQGGIVQAAVSTSLFRSIYEGKTYRSGENGDLQRVPLAGQWGFLPGISLGFGKDLSVKHDVPIILFTNIHYMRQYPYNKTHLIRPALEAGIIIKNQ
ncbi:MAG: hypothetical protein ACK4TA_17760 [Saprospiraceae bacterium]